jgi:hypothetical protein
MKPIRIAWFAMALCLAGCQMPVASLQLLDGLTTALGDTAAGQQKVREAIVSQLDSQSQSLDAAFDADIRNLARPPQDQPDGQGQPGQPTTAPEELTVKLADVLTAKRLYDARRVELDASRAGVADTFTRLDNNLSASRQIADMLRKLVLQQNILAGQADLAIQTLMTRKSSNP